MTLTKNKKSNTEDISINNISTENELQKNNILTDLIRLSLQHGEDFGQEIVSLCGKLASFLNATRAIVFVIDTETSFHAAYEWHSGNLSDAKPLLKGISTEKYKFWEKYLIKPQIIHFADITNIPEDFSKDKNLLRNLDILSMIQVPVMVNETIQGFIIFSNAYENVKYNRNDSNFLNAFCDLLGKTLENNTKKDQTKLPGEAISGLSIARLFSDHPEIVRKVFDHLDFGMAFFDTENNEFIYINNKFSDLFGFDNIRYFKKNHVFKIFRKNGYEVHDFFSPSTAFQKKDFSLVFMDKHLLGYVNPIENTHFITLSTYDISPVSNSEKDEKDFNQQLKVLSEAAINLISFQNEYIYEFIGETAYALLKSGIVIVNRYDYLAKRLQPKFVKGFGLPIDVVSKILGKHPLKKTFPLNQESDLFKKMVNSPVTRIEGGYKELALGTISENVSRQLEKLTGTTKYFACGLSVNGKLYGTITLMLRQGITIRPFVLQTLSRMASTALHNHEISKQLEQTTAILKQTAKIAKIGYWQYDFNNQNLILNKDLIKEIFKTPVKKDVVIPLQVLFRKFMAAEDVPKMKEKFALAAQNMHKYGYSDEMEWTLNIPGREPVIMLTCGEIQKGGWMLGIARDITAEKLKLEREKQIEIHHHASMAKQLFLENMSHEMRTPLNGIIGMTDLLMHAALNSQQKELLGVIKESSDSLLELISNIHEISKIEADCIIVQQKQFNPFQMLNKTIEIFKAAAHQKHIKLQLSIHTDPNLCLIGDEFRLQQILTNLIGNALKFTPENGNVLVEANLESAPENHVKLYIQVNDDGIGIPENKLPLLFDRFSQGDSSYTRQYEGVGIGLSISKELIELMGGTIGVSRKNDKGSIFWIKIILPVCPQ